MCVVFVCCWFSFFGGVDAVLVDGCGIWERLLSFRGVKWAHRSVQDFLFWFCVWCKSRELGGRGIPRFPCLTAVMESFYSDFLWAIISYWTKSHLETSQTSMMELLFENTQRPNDVEYFHKKFHHRCLIGFQMHLWFERCCKYGGCVDCRSMEFVATGWC